MRAGRPSKVKWTTQQESMIRNLYPVIGPKALSEMMGVDLMSLTNRANYLGVKKEGHSFWSEAELSVIRERYESDGPELLAQELNRTYWAIVGKAHELGISTRKPPPPDFEWAPEMIQALQDRYVVEGGDKLAKEFNLNIDTVRSKASTLGLHTIAGHKRWGRERAETSTSCDIHYFDKWSPDMAYILGFIFADGNVNKQLTAITLCLSSRDECVLDFIKDRLKSKHRKHQIPERLHPKTGDVSKSQVSICIASRVLVESIMRRGVLPRKTYNNGPMPEVPDDMLPHFARGLLDGDGTVSISHTGVCYLGFLAPVQFASGLCAAITEQLSVRIPLIHITGDKVEIANFGWGALEDLRKLNDFLYPNQDLFCLGRKRDRLQQWLAEPRWGRGRHPRIHLPNKLEN